LNADTIQVKYFLFALLATTPTRLVWLNEQLIPLLSLWAKKFFKKSTIWGIQRAGLFVIDESLIAHSSTPVVLNFCTLMVRTLISLIYD
jgi:hypothetical protein